MFYVENISASKESMDVVPALLHEENNVKKIIKYELFWICCPLVIVSAVNKRTLKKYAICKMPFRNHYTFFFIQKHVDVIEVFITCLKLIN